MDALTNSRVDKWDHVLEWNIIKALNVCCYYKDKQEFMDFLDVHNFKDKKSVLVQIFSSELNLGILEKVLSEILEVIPQAKIIGATTDGEILGDAVTTDKIVVSVTAFKNAVLDVAMQQECDDSYFCGRELAKKLVSENTKVMIMFSEGLGINGEFFLLSIEIFFF